MKKLAFAIITTICFSCGDSFVPYTLHIDNRTEDTIKIVFLDGSPYKMINPDTLYFPPKQKKLLYAAEGRLMKDGCYTGINENEVEIHTSSERKLRKNIWDVENWECKGARKEGWHLVFVIAENDLE